MNIKIRLLLSGIATHFPGWNRLRPIRPAATKSARYCYSVWLRHLVLAHRNGLCQSTPSAVAELGPGASIGVGLAALLSGAETYCGLDVVANATMGQNLKVFDELVDLFRRRERIPDETEFPRMEPHLDSYDFPRRIINDDCLSTSLAKERVERIRNSIADTHSDASLIRYAAPWFDSKVIRSASVNMIFSQAVLEHVDGLRQAYQAMGLWLAPGGFISHTIDFKSHGTAANWNGHWLYSDLVWKLIRGKRPYLLNREPHSTHVRLLQETGFRIVCDLRAEMPSPIRRDQLAPRFRHLSEQDLVTSGAFIQAVIS